MGTGLFACVAFTNTVPLLQSGSALQYEHPRSLSILHYDLEK